MLKKMSNAIVNVGKGTRKEMKKIRVRDEITLAENPESLYYSIRPEGNRNIQKKHINDMKDFLRKEIESSKCISHPTR